MYNALQDTVKRSNADTVHKKEEYTYIAHLICLVYIYTCILQQNNNNAGR